MATPAPVRPLHQVRHQTYHGRAGSARPGTPYSSPPAYAVQRPQPALIDASLSQPRHLRSPPPRYSQIPQLRSRARIVDLPSLSVPQAASFVSGTPNTIATPSPTLLNHEQPAPSPDRPEPLNLISPRIRFSQLLPTFDNPQTNTVLPRQESRLASPPAPPPRVIRRARSFYRGLFRRCALALDIRKMLQRRQDDAQRREDLLHQARLQKIARVIREEVEARGGLAFRGGLQQDGEEWVDVELGGSDEGVVVGSGRQDGGVWKWVEDVRTHVWGPGSSLEMKSRGVWEWAHREDNMIVAWVRLAVLLCMLAFTLAVLVVLLARWLKG